MSVLITPPAVEPITVADAKLWLKVDNEADDALIEVLISAAREYCEHYCNRAFIRQTRKDIYSPSQTIIHIDAGLNTVIDGVYIDDVAATAGDDYKVQTTTGGGAMITLLTVAENSIEVVYTSGESNATTVPKAVKQAMQLIITDWYENRADNVRRYPTAATNLLNTQRLWTT